MPFHSTYVLVLVLVSYLKYRMLFILDPFRDMTIINHSCRCYGYVYGRPCIKLQQKECPANTIAEALVSHTRLQNV